MDTAYELANLREAKKEVREAQKVFRENAFNLRRMLDDPSLSNETKNSLEDQLFDILENLTEAEQTERDIEELIAKIEELAKDQQVQSDKTVEAIIGVTITLISVFLVMFLFFR